MLWNHCLLISQSPAARVLAHHHLSFGSGGDYHSFCAEWYYPSQEGAFIVRFSLSVTVHSVMLTVQTGDPTHNLLKKRAQWRIDLVGPPLTLSSPKRFFHLQFIKREFIVVVAWTDQHAAQQNRYRVRDSQTNTGFALKQANITVYK